MIFVITFLEDMDIDRLQPECRMYRCCRTATISDVLCSDSCRSKA